MVQARGKARSGGIRLAVGRPPVVAAVALAVAGGLWAGRKRLWRTWKRWTISRNTAKFMDTFEGLEARDPDDEVDEDEEAEKLEVAETLAALDGDGPPPGLAIPHKRRRNKPVGIRLAGEVIPPRAAAVAQRAKLTFGGLAWRDYNQQSVTRWLLKEIKAAMPTVRSKDLLKWMPLMVRYCFYRTDDEIKLDEAMEEMVALGRIRTTNA